ncbi:TadE/TadG family type IV pilus assembly protein [Sphingobium yanoikuyae]|jgi:Flp pilus assembly protein TadG|uniref:TadE/TadG family type IV pilus assembly protein n=1 Tax=Sphingobium yanoikuyae TaxID=13690 RepID=UPI0004E418FE|nr:TadE/TadG family type IV pilus assembly protein [Sphingobium yanoikuyae]KFD29063.1 pilus assembly protein TadG [Sphingobium yanoikuyae]MDV3478881.1 pilus assembly protein TadG-related protein [Sphingobium yanoikuyae]
MGKQIKRAMTFLGRLRRNQAGNTLAMVAAAVIPLAGLIGGGVDMSRAYMVRARMQQACDAAALAGRRAMTTASMTDDNKAEAKKFFDFNFPQQTFGAANFTPVIQSKPGETTTVQVSAETTIPTTIMRIFGIQTLSLAVNCDSRFDIGNTDVMLVLDTTGSMSSNMTDTNGATMTRLAALQQAVKDFYDTLGPGSNATGRIRYGFMPYSSAVNVGYQLPTTALIGGEAGDTWDYQTRRALYETSSTPTICYRRYGLSACYSSSADANAASTSSTLSAANCTSYGNNNGNGNPANSGTAPSTVVTTTYSYDSFNGSTSAASGSNNRKCVRKESAVTKTYSTTNSGASNTKFYTWEYGQFPVDLTGVIAGNSVANPAYNASSKTDVNSTQVASTMTWGGCIEERSTTTSITASTSTASIPEDAHDLQINEAPEDRDTRWRPHLPQVEFKRNGRWMNDNIDNTKATVKENDTNRAGSGGWNACPSQARRLTSYASRSEIPSGQSSSFDSYVDGLIAVGGTYHDIGMSWGARFLSPNGLFAADNRNAPNGFNIARHIVFMTDGDMQAYDSVYGSYGYQKLDGRVAATSSDNTTLTAIHNRRLEMLCNAVKSEGIVVWVIGFKDPPPTGKTDEDMMSPQLQGCANSRNHWFMAYTPSSLRQKFKDIAKNIGGLRLSN